jgi:hypothetical protein
MFAKVSLVLAATSLVIALVALAPAFAADPTTQEGLVVSAGSGKLTMHDRTGKESSHAIDAAVKITVNGKPGKLEDLKASTPIRVTTEGARVLTVATSDEAK